MNPLPKWVLTNPRPAVYDSESGTAVEMTARVYGAMNELIEEYNKYVEALNSHIAKFEAGVVGTNDCFRKNITTVVNEFVKSMDNKVANLEAQLKTNVRDTLQILISEGSLDDTIMNSFENLKTRVAELERNANMVVYDPETESLNMAEV